MNATVVVTGRAQEAPRVRSQQFQADDTVAHVLLTFTYIARVVMPLRSFEALRIGDNFQLSAEIGSDYHVYLKVTE